MTRVCIHPLKVATRVRIPLGLLSFVALEGLRVDKVSSDLLAQALPEINQLTRVDDLAVALSTLPDVVQRASTLLLWRSYLGHRVTVRSDVRARRVPLLDCVGSH